MLELWYEALASSIGIVLSVSDINAAKQALYKARRESADPALDFLSIRVSPLAPQSELWIVKRRE
jgi:hypothetical protein